MSTLPEELLQHVFSYLHLSGEPRARNQDKVRLSTMASISLANRMCYRVVKPHMYHTLILEDYDHTARRRNILRTLLQDADTGSLVQLFYAGSWSLEVDYENTTWQPEPVPDDLKRDALFALDGAGLPTSLRDHLRLQLARGVEDAEIALLLLLVPNIRLLDISVSFHVKESLAMSVIQQGPLQHLSEVKVSHSDTEGSSSIDGLVALLRLPALDTFRGRMIDCNSESSTLLEPIRSTLKRVFFNMSLLDAVGLQRLLVACPDLETLSVHWGSATVGDSSIEYRAIGQALRNHGTKLKNLHLKPEDAEVFDDSLDSDSPLDSLKELAALRLLNVPYHALCATTGTVPKYLVQVLPYSLRTLRIADAEESSSVEDDEDSNEEAFLLDLQLLEVMRDNNFSDLSTIRVQRGDGFTLTAEAEEAGWNDDESNNYWVVLKKQRPQDGDRTG
ncbi:hypothetical protein LTR27_001116 [Elasticomyces elasticus]|nr:hypothetical protein LTR27_001116 [Elasticomyces elasticus]